MKTNKIHWRTKIEKVDDGFLINNRYMIYSCGAVFDTLKAKDIPQYIFRVRAALIGK